MRLPVILRPEAETDIQETYDLPEEKTGLGRRFAAKVRAALERLEAMPELYGVVWEDVRANSSAKVPLCSLLRGTRGSGGGY